jgi:glutamine cyclotransferase
MIYILTWREKVVMRYSYTNQSNDFRWMAPLKWNFEGWGLTHNNSHLIVSDGSDRLFVCDENMTVLETLKVVDLQGNRLIYIN